MVGVRVVKSRLREGGLVAVVGVVRNWMGGG